MSEKQLKTWRSGLKIAGPFVLLTVWILSAKLSGLLFYLVGGSLIFFLLLASVLIEVATYKNRRAKSSF